VLAWIRVLGDFAFQDMVVRRGFMRRASLALVAIVAFAGVGVPVAEAGVTCKVVPSWCPSNNDDKHKGSVGVARGGDPSVGSKQTPVPEPGSLMLLAAGASAVGGAVLRRRKRKKD
jgi:PEP-CTERM motif